MIKNTLERTNDNRFKVTYVPVEVGFVNISIKWNGKDIMNSPFKAAVTNPGLLICFNFYSCKRSFYFRTCSNCWRLAINT